MRGLTMVAEALGTPLVGIGLVVGVGELAWWLLGDFLLDRFGARGR